MLPGRVEGNHLGRRKWGQPQTGKAKESVGEQWGVKELQKYQNSDGFSLTVSQYFWPRQKSGRHHCDWCVANRQEPFGHRLGGRSNSREDLNATWSMSNHWPRAKLCQGVQFPLPPVEQEAADGNSLLDYFGNHMSLLQDIAFKKDFFFPQNCLIWMKNSIKRAVMF